MQPEPRRRNPRLRSIPTWRLTAGAAAFALVAVACSAASTVDTSVPEAPTDTAAPLQGDPAPTLQFATFSGETVTLANYVGKPVVLNFWASWCPSCVAEMSAAFAPVQADLGDQITFIGMNVTDERDLAVALLEETGVQWISAEDAKGDLYIALGGIAMPFTVYLSAEGLVVDKHNGPLTEGQLRDQISEIFG